MCKTNDDREREEYSEWFKPNSDINTKRRYKGIHINPRLPYHFSALDLELRTQEEIDDWHGLAYIEADVQMQDNKAPSIRYCVRRLDGGAWDRPTWKMQTYELEEAVAYAKEYNS